MFESLFERDLLRGERIVWTGQPDSRRMFTAMDKVLVPFSVLWLVFTVFWLLDALGVLGVDFVPDQGPFVVFGMLFLLMALYAAFGRFIFKRWINANTYYALTDQRALILRQARRRTLDAFPLAEISTLEASVRADGSGTVYLASTTFFDAIYGNTGLSFLKSGVYTPAFYDVADVKGLARRIQQMRPRQSEPRPERRPRPKRRR